MKNLMSFFALLIALSFTTTVSAQAQGARFYKNGGFKGANFKHSTGDHWNSGQFYSVGNDNISSVKIDPGYTVILYEHASFKGKKRVLTHSASTLGNFNDKTSSMKIIKSPVRTSYVAAFYGHANYRGARVKLGCGSYSNSKYFGGVGNDAITSLSIKPGYKAILYSNANFKGKIREVTGRISSLSSRDFNDTVSSIRIVKQ
jgi:hypothetical protein